jgi:hypothetical protein
VVIDLERCAIFVELYFCSVNLAKSVLIFRFMMAINNEQLELGVSTFVWIQTVLNNSKVLTVTNTEMLRIIKVTCVEFGIYGICSTVEIAHRNASLN